METAMSVPKTETVVNIKTGEIKLDESAISLVNQQQEAAVSVSNEHQPKKENLLKDLYMRDKNNIFGEILPKEYAGRFAKIFNDGIMDRFVDMAATVSYAMQDSALTEKQKQLVRDLEEAFFDACCIEGPSKRLMKLIEKQPNLIKQLQPKRIKRTWEDLSLSPHRLGFYTTPSGEYIPLFVTAFAMSFGWKRIKFDMYFAKKTGIKHPVGLLYASLLAKYARTLSPDNYPSMWFVLMSIKNLSVCSYIPKNIWDENPELKDYSANFFKLIDAMVDTCSGFMPTEEEMNSGKYDKLFEKPKEDPNPDDNIMEIETAISVK